MARTTPRNLRRGVGRISGSIVEKLNAIGVASGLPGHENVGSELAREINQHLAKISVRQDAQAGFGGPVAIAPQGRQSASGPPPPGLIVGGNRISKVAPAIHGTDAPNLQQVRDLFTCDAFGGHPSGFEGWFEDCVDQRKKVAVPSDMAGIVHAMWGYTYEIPNFTDTVPGDPGFEEFGLAPYWEYIIPVETIVDRVTWWRVGFGPLSGTLKFALYNLNKAPDEFPIVAQSEAFNLATAQENAENPIMLTERVDILPGRYALAYISPCFASALAVNQNVLPMLLTHGLYTTLPHFGFVSITGSTFPDSITTTNFSSYDIENAGTIPVTYWDDTKEFILGAKVS